MNISMTTGSNGVVYTHTHYGEKDYRAFGNHAKNIENAIYAHDPSFFDREKSCNEMFNVIMWVLPVLLGVIAMFCMPADCPIFGRLLVGGIVGLFVFPFVAAFCSNRGEYRDMSYLTFPEVKAVEKNSNSYIAVYPPEYWKACARKK